MSDPKATETENEAAKPEEELDEKALDGVAGGMLSRDKTHHVAGAVPKLGTINASEIELPNDPLKKF